MFSLISCLGMLVGCGSPAPSAMVGAAPPDAGASDSGVITADSSSGGGPRACILMPSNLASLKITGTACGQTISYQSPAALQIHLGRNSIAEDPAVVTLIRIGDLTPNLGASDPGYFDTHDVLLDVELGSGPHYVQGSGMYPLTRGVAWACGLGSMAFGAGNTISVFFDQITVAANGSSGTVQGHIDNLPVAGFTTDFGAIQVPACTGTVAAQFQGPWTLQL